MPTNGPECVVALLALLAILGFVLWTLPGRIRRLCERLAARRLWREVARYLREEDEVIWRG